MAARSDDSSLPDEIITNILMRLPVKSIVRMRCVSKLWNNLFKTPSFITEHLRHSDRKNPFLILHEFNNEHESSSFRLLNHKLETVEVLPIPSIDPFTSHKWNIVGSCNGLLCVLVEENGNENPSSLFLWNPAIREVREVPHSYGDYRWLCNIAFGFSSVINDYKIVIFGNKTFTEDGEIDDRVEVYSLSTDSWKELEFGPLGGAVDNLLEVLSECAAVSVDGTIFWLVRNKIVSFDIATEVFTVRPTPSEDGMHLIGLGVYDNKLACHFGVKEESGHDSICVWLMEEVDSESGKILNRTQEYRTKQMPDVSLSDTLCIWRNEIVCFEDKEIQVGDDLNGVIYLFDLVTDEQRKFNCSSDSHGCCVVNYEKSLVSVWNTQVE